MYVIDSHDAILHVENLYYLVLPKQPKPSTLQGSHWLPKICSRKEHCSLVAGEVGRPERMRGSTLGIQNGGTRMADDKKLKPEDFPVHTEEKKIVKNDGKTIADASDKKVAEDIAERLNADEDLREQDRWSA